MEQYFDAFVHLANWGSRSFMLRIPSYVLNAEIVSEYRDDDVENKNLILSFRTDDEDGEWIDGEDRLSSLIALRADLINGDHRLPVSRVVAIYSGHDSLRFFNACDFRRNDQSGSLEAEISGSVRFKSSVVLLIPLLKRAMRLWSTPPLPSPLSRLALGSFATINNPMTPKEEIQETIAHAPVPRVAMVRFSATDSQLYPSGCSHRASLSQMRILLCDRPSLVAAPRREGTNDEAVLLVPAATPR